jgi:hypothetical protein
MILNEMVHRTRIGWQPPNEMRWMDSSSQIVNPDSGAQQKSRCLSGLLFDF